MTMRSLPVAPDAVDVFLAAGFDLERTVTAAVNAFDRGPNVVAVGGDIAILCAGRSELERRAARSLAELVRDATGRVASIAEPAGLITIPGWRTGSARPGWVPIDVAERGVRLRRVDVRRDIAGAVVLVAVAALHLDRPDRPPLALGMWPGFVHPRLAVAARLGGERVPLAAEIALAFEPRLILLIDQTPTQCFAVAAPDRIAADLVGLALRAEYAKDDTGLLGPWEDSLVQRATELGLGVRLPNQISLRTVWTGRATDDGAAALAALAARLRLALGIPEVLSRSLSD